MAAAAKIASRSAYNMLKLHGTKCLVGREARHGLANLLPAAALFSTSTASTVRLPPKLKPPQQQQHLKSTSSEQQTPTKGFFGRLWNKYSIKGQQDRIHTAESLFQAAMRQANDPRWYGPGRIPRDFRPRHAMLTMHIWFIHKRLINDTLDKNYALLIQEELFNILWDDTTCRIRQAGVNELMVNKNLLQVQQYTFLHLTHYDHAFTPENLQNPEQRMEILRELVWYHILKQGSSSSLDGVDAEDHTESAEAVSAADSPQPELLAEQLNRMAWYIEAQYQNILMDWPDEFYRQARLRWVDLPDFHDMVDVNGKVDPVHPEDVVPPGWVKNITNRGTEYYWNEVTRETSWDRPV